MTPRSAAELEALRLKQELLTHKFYEVLQGLSFGMSPEEHEVVEEYIENREFGIAFDRLCDVVLPGKATTEQDRIVIRLGLEMGPIASRNAELHPWLVAAEL